MPDERVTDALEQLVQFVATSSDSLRQQGHPTDTQLAYGGGALEMLRHLGLIRHAELEEWFARIHEAAGGDARSFTATLAEFQALRGEIVQRIQLQQVLLSLSITVLVALLSVALAGASSRASLLLSTPFVTSALGFAYSDHARRINLLG